MEEPLLQKKAKFVVPKETLCNMFKPSNLDSKASFEIYKGLGGAPVLLRKLKSSLEHGIDSTNKVKMALRVEKYGVNEQHRVKRATFSQHLLQALNNNILKILIVVATLLAVIDIWLEGFGVGWIESASLYAAVFLIVFLSAATTYYREKEFESLDFWETESESIVRRNSQITTVSKYGLVVGDILLLKEGDIVPADSLLLNGKLVVDEGHFTKSFGFTEKLAIGNKPDPFIVSGSKIMKGAGEALVCAVGESRQIFNIPQTNRSQPKPSLQKKLETIADNIGLVGVYIALAAFVTMIGNQVVTRLLLSEDFFGIQAIKLYIEFLTVCIIIVIVAVPEGIPLALSTAWGNSLQKMQAQHIRVKNVICCERLAECNNICVDKTAGLTENRMSIRECYIESEYFQNIEDAYISFKTKGLIGEGICVNTTTHIIEDTGTPGRTKTIGTEFERALLEYAKSIGYNYKEWRLKGNQVAQIPFHKEKRIMSTVVRREHGLRVYTKGSFETVLPNCTVAISSNGEHIPLTMKWKTDIEDYVQIMLKNGRKVLALAYKDMDALETVEDEVELEEKLHNNLVLIAILSIEDRIRPDVPESIRRCKNAGIAVRMVTGESIESAKTIAKNCNVITDMELRSGINNLIMEGPEVEEYVGGLITRIDEDNIPVSRIKHEHKFLEVSANLKVLAKASSTHKLLLVIGLTSDPENIVAMTGHEAMDQEPLRKAHIGFAMGQKGTDIAKEAADVILANDNFSAIVAGIKWGRNAFQAIRKLVQFEIVANMVAILTVCIGSLLFGESPLPGLHLLWINLVIDTMASFSIPTDPPSDEILNDKPYSASKPLINSSMWRYITILSGYQLIVLTLLMTFGGSMFGFGTKRVAGEKWSPTNAELNTIIFNTYVYMQVANFFCCRKIRSREYNILAGLWGNYKFILTQILIVVAQYLIVNYGGEVTLCTPLTSNEQWLCVGLASGTFASWIVAKLIPRSMFAFVIFWKEMNRVGKR